MKKCVPEHKKHTTEDIKILAALSLYVVLNGVMGL